MAAAYFNTLTCIHLQAYVKIDNFGLALKNNASFP